MQKISGEHDNSVRIGNENEEDEEIISLHNIRETEYLIVPEVHYPEDDDSSNVGEESTMLPSVDTTKMPQDGGTLFESCLLMSNSIIGAGIIGLPFSFKEAGIWTGMILLIVLTVVVDWTIRLLVINSKLSGRNSYQDVMYFCFGKSGLIAISVFQFAFAFGGMCAFCVIIGDTIPSVVASIFPSIVDVPILDLLTHRRFVIVLCTVCVSYPLSLYRDISKLAKASGLALISMVVIVVAVAIEGPQVAPEFRGLDEVRWDFVHRELFQAIGVISFAFVCHHNSLLIFDSLKKPTLNRFAAVTHFSTGISMIACILMALSGYLVFTDKTEGNILNNFPRKNFLINIARFCFGFNMFTTLPLEAFVCREVIEIYFFSNSPQSFMRHVISTTALVGGAMTISLLTSDLGIVLELTGGFSATALAYILPPACFLKLASGDWKSRKKIPAVACVAFGIGVMILSTVLSIAKIVTK